MYKTIPPLDPSKVLNTDDYRELRKRYKEIFEKYQEIVNYIWFTQGLGKKDHFHPHKEYLTNLIHETNSLGGNVLNTLGNIIWYVDNGKNIQEPEKKVVEEMKKSVYLHFLRFLTMCQSLYVYYVYDIGKGFVEND